MSLLQMLAFSYYGPLCYYTIDPIRSISQHQQDGEKVQKLLCHFKTGKKEESKFVRVAGTISAAVSVAALSWTSSANQYWLATTFWYISLYFSIAALISSASGRMLNYIPDTTVRCYSDEELQILMHLVLDFPPPPVVPHRNSPGSTQSSLNKPQAQKIKLGIPSRRKQFIWQMPTMFMSWSWVTFLLGFTFHVLTPVIMREAWTIECTSAVVVVSIAFVTACAWLASNNYARKLAMKLSEFGLNEVATASVL